MKTIYYILSHPAFIFISFPITMGYIELSKQSWHSILFGILLLCAMCYSIYKTPQK